MTTTRRMHRNDLAHSRVGLDDAPVALGEGQSVEGDPDPGPDEGIAGDVLDFREAAGRGRPERGRDERLAALLDLSRRKDEFLAVLAHELRNPLAPILNAVLLLALEENGNPTRERTLALIERQVGQLARLIDDLVDVARIATGRLRLRWERLDLRATVTRAVEAARSLLDRKGHALTVSLPRGPVWLSGDPTRLEQVVVNLLNNAAKYTDPGGRISLTLRPRAGEAILRLRDTGIGIDAAILPRVFDLFAQAGGPVDRSEGGFGVGLALVRQLVLGHGGTVGAKSDGPGLGSEFVVRLPLLPGGHLVSAEDRG